MEVKILVTVTMGSAQNLDFFWGRIFLEPPTASKCSDIIQKICIQLLEILFSIEKHKKLCNLFRERT